MGNTDTDEIVDAKVEALADAIVRLAKRRRGPADLPLLFGAGSHDLDLIAAADSDDLAEAIDCVSGGLIIGDQGELARALGYAAGLALTLRQALRHHCDARVEPAAHDAAESEKTADGET